MNVSLKLRLIQRIKGLGKSKLLFLVKNKKLTNVINELFKASDKLEGGTAGAVRQEIATGLPVSKRFHMTKAGERATNLKNILRNENLSPVERDIAEALLIDLKQAVKGQ